MSLLRPDICIIGAGAGGLSLAAAAAAFGVPVVLIEKGEMGGDCLNAGCVPSKALIAAANAAEAVRRAPAFGVAAGPPQPNYARLRDHVRSVIADIAPNDAAERFRALGVTVIRAHARFVDRGAVEAGGVLVKARRFVLATGSRPAVPPVPGLEALPFLTNETVFDLTRRPARLLVLGGGPVGVELAQAHRRFGAEVTLVEAARLLPREDPEAADMARRALLADGVALHEGAKVLRAEPGGQDGVALVLETDAGEQTIAGSHLLLAAGRRAVVDDLGLDAAGIRTDEAGIVVDRGLRTSNRRVYAIGDCASGAAGALRFTHVANHHAGLVLRNALFRLPVRVDRAAIPRVTFCDPEIAAVGLGEAEARARHAGVQTLRWPFAENDRAQAERRGEGFVKIVADRRGRVLGATIAGPNAGELVAPWTIAVERRLKLSDMAGFVMPYPTLSEASRRVAVSAFAPLTQKPLLRRLIGFLRRFG